MFLDNEDEIFNQWNDVKKRTQEKNWRSFWKWRKDWFCWGSYD